MVVDQDKSNALLSVVLLNIHGNMPVIYVRLDGLDEEREYRDADTGKVYSGAALMEAGMPIPLGLGDYQAFQILFEVVE